MSAFKPVQYEGTLTPLQRPIRFLNKEKHSNSIGYKVDKKKRTITNIVLLKRGSKGGQSSGSSKRYHSRIQPEFIGRGFNSLHLIPRSFTGLSGNDLNVYASQNINEQMQVTEDELRQCLKQHDCLYVVEVTVEDNHSLTVTQAIYRADTTKKIRKVTLKDTNTRYEFISEKSTLESIPNVMTQSKVSKWHKRSVKNPFYGNLTDDEFKSLVDKLNMSEYFKTRKVVPKPVRVKSIETIDASLAVSKTVAKSEPKHKKVPSVSVDVKMLGTLVEHLKERKLNKADKEHIKNQLAALINML